MAVPSDSASRPSRRALRLALVALLVGFVLGVALVWSLGGNPLSTTNEVEYRDVQVAVVDTEGGQICWQEEIERDSAQQCAILALDPQQSLPGVGDTATLGIVELETPGDDTPRLVVWAAGGAGGAGAANPSPLPTPADG